MAVGRDGMDAAEDLVMERLKKNGVDERLLTAGRCYYEHVNRELFGPRVVIYG